jgi:DNA-binding SARP family transcriptional activator
MVGSVQVIAPELALSLARSAVHPSSMPELVLFSIGLVAGAALVAIRQASRRRHAGGSGTAPPSPPSGTVPARRPAGFPDRTAALPPGLRIGVLGPLTVNGRPAGLLPAQSQLLVALALADGGVANRRLCELLGPEPGRPRPSDSLRQLIVRTRRQLGRSADGREWIEHTGYGRYALHRDARFDWSEFDTLAVQGIAAHDADQLRRALLMVRGEPFADCCYWWLDLALVERVRQRIVTAATTLAEWELDGRSPAAAARSARAGLAADCGSEQLWQLLMRAEHAAGNLSAVRDVWSRCLTAVAEVAAGQQPEPRTERLFRALMSQGPN